MVWRRGLYPFEEPQHLQLFGGKAHEKTVVSLCCEVSPRLWLAANDPQKGYHAKAG